jgi:hypothetical protein
VLSRSTPLRSTLLHSALRSTSRDQDPSAECALLRLVLWGWRWDWIGLRTFIRYIAGLQFEPVGMCCSIPSTIIVCSVRLGRLVALMLCNHRITVLYVVVWGPRFGYDTGVIIVVGSTWECWSAMSNISLH